MQKVPSLGRRVSSRAVPALILICVCAATGGVIGLFAGNLVVGAAFGAGLGLISYIRYASSPQLTHSHLYDASGYGVSGGFVGGTGDGGGCGGDGSGGGGC